jgi:hypothetical protein
VFKKLDVSAHKNMDVLQAYVRDADLLRDHAGAGPLQVRVVGGQGAKIDRGRFTPESCRRGRRPWRPRWGQ